MVLLLAPAARADCTARDRVGPGSGLPPVWLGGASSQGMDVLSRYFCCWSCSRSCVALIVLREGALNAAAAPGLCCEAQFRSAPVEATAGTPCWPGPGRPVSLLLEAPDAEKLRAVAQKEAEPGS